MCYTQNLTQGSVSDNLKFCSLPFVNIGIKGTHGGTTTNGLGEFSINLPSNPKYRTLVFSSIGYESKEYTVKEGESNLSIHLAPHTYDIDEITIMPDSTLRSFLRKAFNKIPDNYSSVPTKYEGFYRASIQNQKGEYLRFMEVLTEAYKSSYKNKEEGTMKVLKSRKYIAKNDVKDFPVYYYGGVHQMHYLDYVKSRAEFLSGSHKYNYNLVGQTKNRGKIVYKISFAPSNIDANRSKGYFYIEHESLAYLKIEKESTPAQLEKRSTVPALTLNGLKSIYFDVNVNYTAFDGKFYLKSVIRTEDILKQRDSVTTHCLSEYIISSFDDDEVGKIAFEEQAPITYTPSVEAVFYHQSDWKEFNTLPLEGNQHDLDSLKVKSILSSNAKRNSDWRINMMKIMRNLEFSYVISINGVNSAAANYQLDYQHLNFKNDKNSSDYVLSYATQIGYKISPHNVIQGQTAKQFSRESFIKNHYYSYKRLIPLKTMGHQIIANVNMGWEWQKVGFSLGTQKSGQDFYFGGKKFKNEKIQAYAGYKSNGLSVGSGIDFQLSNLIHLSLSGNYFIPSKTQDIIILQERSGFFLGRKGAQENLSNSNIQYSIDGLPSLKCGLENKNWNVIMGIKMKF